jgi:small basic protein (TIGR04137 family)
MSMDRSLKSASALVRHRNVLTRGERLEKLTEAEKWDEKKSPFGLPKVAHRKAAVIKTVKEEVVEGAVPGAPAAAGAAPAAGAAKGAAGAKGAAPAGAKGAAPAAKAAAPAKKK